MLKLCNVTSYWFYRAPDICFVLVFNKSEFENFHFTAVTFSFVTESRKLITHLKNISKVSSANIWVFSGIKRNRVNFYKSEHSGFWVSPQHHSWTVLSFIVKHNFIGTGQLLCFCQMKESYNLLRNF